MSVEKVAEGHYLIKDRYFVSVRLTVGENVYLKQRGRNTSAVDEIVLSRDGALSLIDALTEALL